MQTLGVQVPLAEVQQTLAANLTEQLKGQAAARGAVSATQ
jgi:hypothetical protein